MITESIFNLISVRHYKGSQISKMEDSARSYHVLTFCVSGEFDVIINEEKYSIGSGDVFYVAPNEKRFRPQTLGTFEILTISFNYEGSRSLEQSYYKRVFDERMYKAIELLEYAGKEKNAEKATLMLKYVFADIESRDQKATENLTVRKIKEFIYQNSHQKLSVDDVAKHVYLSKIYCENIFKKATGQTLITFINNEKVRLAREYLATSEMSLVKVSEQLGFTDYNYFSRLFKKVTGISPLQFRNKQNINKKGE